MFSLVSNIISDYFFIPVLSNGVDVVSAGPELASPEDAGDLGVTAEKLAGRDTLDDCGETCGGNGGNALEEEVDVVFVRPDLDEADFVGGTKVEADVFERLFNRLREYLLSVFGGTNQVIEEQGLVVALENVVSHGTMLPRPRRTPQRAAGNSLD